MKSYEAIAKAVNGLAVEFAKRLRLSTSLLYKWMEPCIDYSDSGALNPLDRLEMLIEIALQLNSNRDDALAPLQCLNEHFKLIAFPRPQKQQTITEISQELLKTISEFGILAQYASTALEDGIVTSEEAQNINVVGWRLLRQVAVFLQSVKEGGGSKVNRAHCEP